MNVSRRRKAKIRFALRIMEETRGHDEGGHLENSLEQPFLDSVNPAVIFPRNSWFINGDTYMWE